MNQGAKMLLARMESHPEEFAFQFAYEGGCIDGRWDDIMRAVVRRIEGRERTETEDSGEPLTFLPFLTDEETRALYDKYVSIQGDAFTRYIMSELLGAGEEPEKMTTWTPLSASSSLITVTKEQQKALTAAALLSKTGEA